MNTFSPEAQSVRDAIAKSISVMGLTFAQTFLTFAGILPLFLPNGTRVVILPDIHAPGHHKQLMWAIRQFLAWYRPHVLIFIGDLADIFAMSRHPKPLRPIIRPQDEFEVTRRLLDDLIEASGAIHTFVILGNHEDRVYRFLQELAPMLGGILDPHTREPMSFHSLLGYNRKDNITFIYGTEERGGFEGGLWINNHLGMHHGSMVRAKAGMSPLSDMDKYFRAIMHGHTHRLGMIARDVNPSKRAPTGVLVGTELGMLADPSHHILGYAHEMWPNWHFGFATGLVHNGVVHTQSVPIVPMTIDGKEKLSFNFGSKVFSESDR